MEDELKKIELAAAKTRLEREQLALENERDKRRRIERATELASNVVSTSKEVGGAVAAGVGSLIVFLIVAVLTAGLFGLFGLAAAALWVVVSPRKAPGDFMYQLGVFLAQGGWMVVAGACGIGLWLLWFGKKS